MKKTSAELKQIAQGKLKGHFGIPMGTFAVTGFILFLIFLPLSLPLNSEKPITYTLIFQFFISFISTILYAGQTRIHLRLSRNELPDFLDLFYSLKTRPARFILANFLLSLITMFWFIPGIICFIVASLSESILLLVIGGILSLCAIAIGTYIELKFGLLFILLTDHPSMDVIEAFRESSRLMDGNKGRLFYIQLSFIGWALLGCLSCFIGFLWIEPYRLQTFVCFYRDIVKNTDYTLTE